MSELRSPHADKFRVALAGLVGIALGAIAVAVAVVIANSNGGSTPSAHWSSWSPNETGAAGATQIADYVGPYYRSTASQQLDVVSLISLGNAQAAAEGGTTSGMLVAVNETDTNDAEDLSLLGGRTIAYSLCGLGTSNCTLAGTPSANRLLLLRREALELALYTFKYLPKTQNVIAVLPPGKTTVSASSATATLSPTPPSATPAKPKTESVTVAVLFDRAELSPFLSEPLSETLSEFPPDISQLALWKKTEEAGLVDQITARGLFAEKIESEQDGSNLLVLDPLPSQ